MIIYNERRDFVEKGFNVDLVNTLKDDLKDIKYIKWYNKQYLKRLCKKYKGGE